jgi:hypothetical protein
VVVRKNRTAVKYEDLVGIGQKMGARIAVKKGETKLFAPEGKASLGVHGKAGGKGVTRIILVNWTTDSEDAMAFEGKPPASTVEQEVVMTGEPKEILARFYRLLKGLLAASKPVEEPTEENTAPQEEPSLMVADGEEGEDNSQQ